MSIRLENATVPTPRLVKMREALTPHVGHEVSVNGYINSVPDIARSTDEDLAWRYMGFSVRCLRCLTSISEEWNG